jgi:hypothetical protein
VRVHLAREHALELEFLDVALEARGVRGDVADRRGFGLGLGELEQLERAVDPVANAVEAAGQRLELGAFAAERLGALGCVPDPGVLELATDLGEPLALADVLKDTPLRRRGVPRDP